MWLWAVRRKRRKPLPMTLKTRVRLPCILHLSRKSSRKAECAFYRVLFRADLLIPTINFMCLLTAETQCRLSAEENIIIKKVRVYILLTSFIRATTLFTVCTVSVFSTVYRRWKSEKLSRTILKSSMPKMTCFMFPLHSLTLFQNISVRMRKTERVLNSTVSAVRNGKRREARCVRRSRIWRTSLLRCIQSAESQRDTLFLRIWICSLILKGVFRMTRRPISFVPLMR